MLLLLNFRPGIIRSHSVQNIVSMPRACMTSSHQTVIYFKIHESPKNRWIHSSIKYSVVKLVYFLILFKIISTIACRHFSEANSLSKGLIQNRRHFFEKTSPVLHFKRPCSKTLHAEKHGTFSAAAGRVSTNRFRNVVCGDTNHGSSVCIVLK